MTSVNILPGSLNVTGNISATQASVGGNLVVGSNIYVSGNLYSANVTVSGGGGGGGGGSGVSSIVAGNGITTSTSTGNVTVNAVVAGICGGAGIDVVSNGGVWTLCADVASINAGQGIFVDNTNRAVTIRNTGVFGPINITNDSGTGNLIGGVSLSDGKIGATNVVNQILCGNSGATGIYSVGNATTGTVSLRTKVVNIAADPNVTVRNLDGTFYIGATGGGGGGGVADASEWSTYPATRDVSMNGWSLENVYNIIGSGEAYELQGDMEKPSYIGNLTINSVEPGLLILHSYEDSRVIISGDSNGREGVWINPAGSISNNANTRNFIGGIQLSNSNIDLVQRLNLKNDGLGIISNVRQIVNNQADGSKLDLSVGGVSRINDLVIDSAGNGPILRPVASGSNFYISADPSSSSGTTNSVFVSNDGSLVGNRYKLSNTEGGGRINIFGNSNFNDSGPKGMLETISGGTEVAVGQYRNSVNASDALNIYCGPDPRIVVKNDIVRFSTPISNSTATSNNIGGVSLSGGQIYQSSIPSLPLLRRMVIGSFFMLIVANATTIPNPLYFTGGVRIPLVFAQGPLHAIFISPKTKFTGYRVDGSVIGSQFNNTDEPGYINPTSFIAEISSYSTEFI